MRDLLTALKELDDDPAKMEAAAKKLCERHGRDPMDFAPYDNGTLAHTVRPRWQNVREELQEMATTLLCLTEE